MGNQER